MLGGGVEVELALALAAVGVVRREEASLADLKIFVI